MEGDGLTTQDELTPTRPSPILPRGARPGDVRSAKFGTFWIGTYPVGMRVKMNDGGVGEDTVDLSLRPYPPKANLNVGKFSFPTRIIPITSKNKAIGASRRTEFFGAIVTWTAQDLEELSDYLKRTWIRWRSRHGKLQDHGYPIVIPTQGEIDRAREIAEMEKRQVRMPQYAGFVPRVDDEPFSQWVYVVKVEDGTLYPPLVKNDELPEPVSVTGIEPVE